MLELAELILHTLYEESGGRIEQPLDPLAVFFRRYPKIPGREIAAELTALAAEGLLVVRTQSGAALTTDGLRRLGELIEEHGGPPGNRADTVYTQLAARRSTPDPAEEGELDFDQILELMSYGDEGDNPAHERTTQPPVSVPAQLAAAKSMPVGEDEADEEDKEVVSLADQARDPASVPPPAASAPPEEEADDALDAETPLSFGGADHDRTLLDDLPSLMPSPVVSATSDWEKEQTDTADEEESTGERPAGATPLGRRLTRIRGEVELLTKELGAVPSLPVQRWTEALDLVKQLEATVAKIAEIIEEPPEPKD